MNPISAITSTVVGVAGFIAVKSLIDNSVTGTDSGSVLVQSLVPISFAIGCAVLALKITG